jgi:hypothetical protein
MLVQFSKAAQICGLTEHQLKEWCMRRRLVQPDVPARGRGNNALFGWRSLLAVRILAALHVRFGGTVSHWGPLVEQFRVSLEGFSFLALHGQAFVSDGHTVSLKPVAAVVSEPRASIALPLAEHLSIIIAALGHQNSDQQLQLLLPVVVNR